MLKIILLSDLLELNLKDFSSFLIQDIECNLANIHPTADVQARMMAIEQEVPMIHLYRAGGLELETTIVKL